MHIFDHRPLRAIGQVAACCVKGVDLRNQVPLRYCETLHARLGKRTKRPVQIAISVGKDAEKPNVARR